MSLKLLTSRFLNSNGFYLTGKAALNFHNQDFAKTYVFVNKNNVVFGYIALTCGEIIFNEAQRPKNLPHTFQHQTFPAAKIARLAIDQHVQKQRLGSKLIEWCSTHIYF